MEDSRMSTPTEKEQDGKSYEMYPDGYKFDIREIKGGSVSDLRDTYFKRQHKLASEREDYDSDSEPEVGVNEQIQYLADEDTTWFTGCGLNLTLEMSIRTTQVIMAFVVTAFCIVKLWKSDDCSTVSTYAPLLSAIVMHILSNIKRLKHKNKKK